MRTFVNRRTLSKFAALAVVWFMSVPAADAQQNAGSLRLPFGDADELQALLLSKDSAPPIDKLCSRVFDTPDILDNGTKLVQLKALLELQQRATKAPRAEVETAMRNAAKQLLWIPPEVERMVAEQDLQSRIDRREAIAGKGLRGQDRTRFVATEQALEKLVALLPKDQPFGFRLFASTEDAENAEAMPGGLIYVSRSALRGSSEMIVAVLAHEVAHVTKRHFSRRLQVRLVDAASSRLEVLRLVRGDRKFIDELLRRTGARGLRFDQFGTEQELEADACAARMMVQSGLVEPERGVEAFLGMLEKAGARKRQDGQGTIAAVSVFGARHPAYEQRQARMHEGIVHWRRTALTLPVPSTPQSAPPNVPSAAPAESTTSPSPATSEQPAETPVGDSRGVGDKLKEGFRGAWDAFRKGAANPTSPPSAFPD